MTAIFHPRPDDYGKPVKINKPSRPTSLSHFDDPSAIVAILPDGEVPESLNGIRFESWADAPVTMAEWLTGSGQGDFAEPPMVPKPGKKLSAGVVTVEPDGRVWVVSPTNQFGGYSVTFPKGTIDAGMTAKSAAIREALEESGLQVELIALIGDFERTTSVTRYYLAKRVGGNPADCGWESQCVWLIPKERLLETLSHPADKPLIEKVLAMLAKDEAMWIFLPDSFLSIVDKGDPSGKTLLVRARHAGDIEWIFPDADVQIGGGTDYRYRARIDREVVALTIADAIRSINWSNFKSQVTEQDRHDAYMECWEEMYAYQKAESSRHR